MNVRILEADVVWRELDGDVVILNLATGHYYGLEGTANEMWRLLLQHGSTEKVVEQMAREFDADAARIRADLETFIADLAARSIVHVDAA